MMTAEQAWSQMPMTTSAGYPFSLISTNKTDLVKKCPNWFSYLEEMQEALRDPDEMPSFIWTSSVKAEMRPIEKARANKLRTFTASPADHSTLLNMLCLDMNNKFYGIGKDQSGWSCVGMSKYARNWHRLAIRLLRHKTGWALDGNSFDSSVFRASLEDIAKFRSECLNADQMTDLAMKRLYVSVIESLMVLTNGDVVQKLTGNPSGCVNTVVDNTLHLFRMLAYAWKCLAPPELSAYTSFMEHVETTLW
jgi:hypothetical protein